MGRRRFGVFVTIAGVVAILVVQRVAPVLTPPLYDGVAVEEPYRWIPRPPGQAFDPTAAADVVDVTSGGSPLIALGTGEQPPQAQIFAGPGAFELPKGTARIKVSITPVAPTLQPTDGHIDGNVYRISVTNQAGVELTAPLAQQVTVVLRAPGDEPTVRIAQLTGGAWKALATKDAGFGSSWLAVVTGFGDFALVAPGPPKSHASGAPIAGATPHATTGTGGTAGPSTHDGAAGQGGFPSAIVAVLIALAIVAMLIASDIRRRNRRRPGAVKRRR